jgi:hypothetical protein
MKCFKFSLLLFSTILYKSLFSQTTTIVEGRIIDGKTNAPLEFANIRFKGNLGGVRSDTAGYYKISTTNRPKTIVISYLGYETKDTAIQAGKSNHIDIRLNPLNVNLKEVIVKPPKRKKKREIDTAALYVFHHVVANKERNRASGINNYHYKEYTKMVWSVLNPTKRFLNARFFRPYRYFFEKKDTDETGRIFIPMFVQEDYMETYYRKKPQHKVNVVHYRHISGLKNPAYIKLIGYHFQVSDAYEDVHVIFQKSFISPFSPGANVVYNYHILDTSKIDGRTSYKLNFVGRVKEDLCTKGYAWIDSATWAIKSISYGPNQKANLDYIFYLNEEQDFQMVNDSQWMMTHEHQIIEANLIKKPDKLAFRVDKTTERKEITTNIAVPDSIMKHPDDIVDPNAYKRKLSYIDSVRFDSLTVGEKLVYHHFDTVRHTPAYIGLSEFATFVTTANIKAGPVDFGRTYRILSRNNVEGWRIRMGVYSNGALSDKVFLGAYGAYGTTDKRWKYSFNARTLLPSKYERWHAIELEYKSDMLILGQENPLITYDNITNLISGLTLTKIMRTQEINLYYERDWIKGLSSNMELSNKTFYSVPGIFNFAAPDGHGNYVNLPSFNTTEVSTDLRYCKTDYYYEYYTYRNALESRTPAITFKYTLGFKNKLFGGDYTYQKFLLTFFHRAQMPAIGFLKITARAGYILGNTPYPLAYLASSNIGIIKDELSFQSTAPFEFVYDKFASIWLEHDFDGFFMNRIPFINKLHIREVVQVKAVIGDFSSQNASLMPLPSGMYSPFPKPYIEAGFGFENILNIVQVNFLWRCTYRDNPLAPNFTVKIGIYPGF